MFSNCFFLSPKSSLDTLSTFNRAALNNSLKSIFRSFTCLNPYQLNDVILLWPQKSSRTNGPFAVSFDGPCREKIFLILLRANDKGADQAAHPHSLVSTFVIRSQKIITTLMIANLPYVNTQYTSKSL